MQTSSTLVPREKLRDFLRPEIFLLFYVQFKEIPKEELDVQIEECLKYLYLASSYEIFSGSFIPVSKEIDEIWHYLIIQTRDYARLCQNLPGGKFIHHQSIHFSQFSEARSRSEIMTTFLQWIAYYQVHFGPMSDQTAPYWVIVKFLMQYFDFSLETIHQLAKEVLGHRDQKGFGIPHL